MIRIIQDPNILGLHNFISGRNFLGPLFETHTVLTHRLFQFSGWQILKNILFILTKKILVVQNLLDSKHFWSINFSDPKYLGLNFWDPHLFETHIFTLNYFRPQILTKYVTTSPLIWLYGGTSFELQKRLKTSPNSYISNKRVKTKNIIWAYFYKTTKSTSFQIN